MTLDDRLTDAINRREAEQNPMTTGRIIRVTDEQDGDLVPRMYSYWANAFVRDGAAFVFAGHREGWPVFSKVNLADGSIERLDWLLPYGGETEGWYWDRDGSIYLVQGPRLHRVNPFTGEDGVVFDISDERPGCNLWQTHSSDDGQTHSATVQRSSDPYTKVGTVVVRDDHQDFFPAQGTLDESAITADGKFLIIKETPEGAERVSNRIINVETRETIVLLNADGAVGHSDCGMSVLVGEWSPGAGVPGVGSCVLWNLAELLTPGRRVELFKTWNMGYVAVRGSVCINSDEHHLNLVALDGSGLHELVAHGNTGTNYDNRVKANLSPCGRVACYMSNQYGRRDAFLVVLS